MDLSFPVEPLEKLGYSVEIYGQKSYNGVAIISKIKPENVKKGFYGCNFFTLLIFLKIDYLNAEYLFEELEIDASTKTEDDSSAFPTNPFEIVEMIRRQNSMNDATDPSDAIEEALKSFNGLEE